LFAAVILGSFHWFGHLFLANHDVPGALAAWGVTRGNLPLVLWFMTLVNGPAEEMYWRGFVLREVGGLRPGFGPILLVALFYASYHGLTVHLLVGALPVAVLFMAAVVAAGLFWGWLRARTGSLWPALISHTAATGAYLAVAGPLLEI
jgi:membrane protease YdiL (CAAX protease family)